MKSSKSSLFLIELIISILFFSLASAACIQLFVKAHLLDKKTQETNQIVMWTQNLAELWYASDGEIYPIYERLVLDYDVQDSSILLVDNDRKLFLYFDKDWKLCDISNQDAIAYRIEFFQSGIEGVSYIDAAEIYFYSINGNDTTLLHNQFLSQHMTMERGYFYE